MSGQDQVAPGQRCGRAPVSRERHSAAAVPTTCTHSRASRVSLAENWVRSNGQPRRRPNWPPLPDQGQSHRYVLGLPLAAGLPERPAQPDEHAHCLGRGSRYRPAATPAGARRPDGRGQSLQRRYGALRRPRRRRRSRKSHAAWTSFRLRAKCSWAARMLRLAALRRSRAITACRRAAAINRAAFRRSGSSSRSLRPSSALIRVYASEMPRRGTRPQG